MKQSESLAYVPGEYMQCRAFNHSFEHITDHVTKQKRRGFVIEFVRDLKCAHCGLECSVEVDVETFTIKRRKYRYPDGFQVKGGAKKYESREEYLLRLGLKFEHSHKRDSGEA